MKRSQPGGLRGQRVHSDFVPLQHYVIGSRGGGAENQHQQNEASANSRSHGESSRRDLVRYSGDVGGAEHSLSATPTKLAISLRKCHRMTNTSAAGAPVNLTLLFTLAISRPGKDELRHPPCEGIGQTTNEHIGFKPLGTAATGAPRAARDHAR